MLCPPDISVLTGVHIRYVGQCASVLAKKLNILNSIFTGGILQVSSIKVIFIVCEIWRGSQSGSWLQTECR